MPLPDFDFSKSASRYIAPVGLKPRGNLILSEPGFLTKNADVSSYFLFYNRVHFISPRTYLRAKLFLFRFLFKFLLGFLVVEGFDIEIRGFAELFFKLIVAVFFG